MPVYALTIFLSSFLLFQVQPLIGRYILPWYGGGPAVWTTCMLFFQVVLLAGYGYAHVATLLDRWKQGWLHLALLLCALMFLPIAPSPDYWKLRPDDNPALKILLLLLANVGAPYLLLSATAPLVQHWFIRSFPGRSPYRLYALSNLGSLLALLSYPFLVEPNLTLAHQVSVWGWGFGVFVLFCSSCALQIGQVQAAGGAEAVSNSGAGAAAHDAPSAVRPSMASFLLWLSLSACGSAMLLATTNMLCQDIAVVPFLWVIPLALYLVTFILCFNSEKAANRLVWGTLTVAAIIAACYQLVPQHNNSLTTMIVVYLAALFTCCMSCHGELARSRPAPRHLTAYYLVISLGGALGGCFVALVAPLAFNDFWEYPLSLAGTFFVLIVAWRRDGVFTRTSRWVPGGLVTAQLALCVFLAYHVVMTQNGSVTSVRNFYGALKVYADTDTVGKRLLLLHGRVKHGWQYSIGALRRLPTAYYGPESGVGLALRFHPRRFSPDIRQRSLRVGVIGLGAGTLAAYGQSGDLFRFYEINPAVITLADRFFSYCRDSAARVEFVPGDARITLEAELQHNNPQGFDVLVVDAFSGDAIPIHLLTQECFAIYRRHLKPDGLLAVHISNKFLDLLPAVRTQGRSIGYWPVVFRSPENDMAGIEAALWVVLIPDIRFINTPEVSSRADFGSGTDPAPLVWTDDFASLWHILKR
ncbi:fused MFS/spermidine synthase [Oryzomonas rubra]|uniref:Ferrichrome ABC transporter permease n=1 Tax=Oryzomonas rubra TaxID=2509454 RepID=A0A5A9XFU4_9BACT|nr:fused MFS/spermidine synthase [Oryzomonas rubra]KAA0891325.1 ferrichrome ABC transporter permease [Oryzomonas rubra]